MCVCICPYAFVCSSVRPSVDSAPSNVGFDVCVDPVETPGISAIWQGAYGSGGGVTWLNCNVCVPEGWRIEWSHGKGLTSWPIIQSLSFMLNIRSLSLLISSSSYGILICCDNDSSEHIYITTHVLKIFVTFQDLCIYSSLKKKFNWKHCFGYSEDC